MRDAAGEQAAEDEAGGVRQPPTTLRASLKYLGPGMVIAAGLVGSGELIATTKACFVAAIFMHLNHEKFMVYLLFAFGLFFGAAMFLLIWLAKSDPIWFERFQLGLILT